MNFLRHLILGIISFVQTVLGWLIVWCIASPEAAEYYPVLGFVVILAGLTFLACWVRGIRDWGLLLGIPEFILSPFAIFRHAVGTVAYILSRKNPNISFNYSEDLFDPDGPLQKLLKYLFGFYYDGACTVSKLSNIMTQIFICIPVAAAETFCFWGAINSFKNDAFPIIPLFLLGGITLSSALLCAVRGQESEVSYFHGIYSFKNEYTNKKITKHSDSPNTSYTLEEGAEERGWHQTSDGYGSYYTAWMIFTMLFSPIMVFTQAIGLVFALISSPSTHILSCYTKLDYDEFSLPFFQRILHFLFNFVIY